MVGLCVIFTSVFLMHGLQASCPTERFGDSCRYYCNCYPCDDMTGVCTGHCTQGWIKGGGMCQKQNVALGRQASTTSGYLGSHYRNDDSKWLPKKAVDGNTSIRGEHTTCFHADRSPSDWTVDLGQKYQLYDIRVYLRARYKYRTANSIIYLDNNSSRVCYTFNSHHALKNPTYATCNGTASLVTIKNPEKSHGHGDTLNICEVEIYACSNGTYGSNCSLFCHCHYCDRWTGVCDGDCYPGWEGDRCDTECTDRTYGVNCNQSCANRKCVNNMASCDRYKGSCNTGCLPGFKGSPCTDECDKMNYGKNCSSLCDDRHCSGHSSCNHKTGSCDQGCNSGWTGLDCRQACEKDHYGPNCTEMCSTRHCEGGSTCNHTTGQCDQGCEAGWDGIDCKLCVTGYYGSNCSNKCGDRHCHGNSSCDHVIGSCDLGCVALWQGEDCTIAVTDLAQIGIGSKLLMFGAVTGGVVVLFLVLVLALVLALVLIRRKRAQTNKTGSHRSEGVHHKYQDESANVYANFEYDEDKQKQKNPTPAIGLVQLDGAISRDPDSRSVDSLEEEDYGNKAGLEEDPESNYCNLEDVGRGHVIPVSQLEFRVKEMERRPKIDEEEFKNLPDGFFHPYDESQKPGNKEKNRFKGYYPYNYNRVVILDNRDVSRGDYINASYLDGYKHLKKYIAAQGPFRDDIVVDFWRMIWQEKCEVVVMVTGLVEGTKMKCLRYWPEKGTTTYGDVTVTMETQTILADYTITKLSVKVGKASSTRQLTHFNYTSWPDHGVPDTSGLLSFMWRVQKTCGQQKHPVVVHCSAGIGRTGTYIAVESLVSQATTEGTVDVVSFVSKMRSQRKNMIQTKEQYLFIYQAVMAAVVDGDTSLDSDVISNHIDLDNLNDVTMGNKTVQQHLQTMEEQPVHTDTSHIACIPSYKRKSGFFVVTSHPDKETVWNQIYNSSSRSLITWADGGLAKSYLPSAERSVSTSRLSITLISSSILSDCVALNNIDIKTKNDKVGTLLHHYHVTGSVQQPGLSLLIDEFLQWTRRPGCEHSTVISHSISETRLLILLVNITSRLQDDGKVDVISNMRRLQSLLGGPRFTVSDVRQCIKSAQRYLESQEVYVNM